MIIKLLCIAKTKEEFVSLGLSKYLKKLKGIVPVEIIEIKMNRDLNKQKPEVVKAKEAEQIVKRLEKDSYIIALDEHGKQFSSAGLADLINSLQNQAYKRIVFIVGGSLGLDKTILDKSNLILSFSLLTFPHQLVRLIAIEQIYRAFTIIRGEPYHK